MHLIRSAVVEASRRAAGIFFYYDWNAMCGIEVDEVLKPLNHLPVELSILCGALKTVYPSASVDNQTSTTLPQYRERLETQSSSSHIQALNNVLANQSLFQDPSRCQTPRHTLSFQDLADLVCHELRNPLTGILGYIELFKEIIHTRKMLLLKTAPSLEFGSSTPRSLKRKKVDEDAPVHAIDEDLRDSLFRQLRAEEECLKAIEICASHGTVATDRALELSQLYSWPPLGPPSPPQMKEDGDSPAHCGDSDMMLAAHAPPLGVPVEMDLMLLIRETLLSFEDDAAASVRRPDLCIASDASRQMTEDPDLSSRMSIKVAKGHHDGLKRVMFNLVSNALAVSTGRTVVLTLMVGKESGRIFERVKGDASGSSLPTRAYGVQETEAAEHPVVSVDANAFTLVVGSHPLVRDPFIPLADSTTNPPSSICASWIVRPGRSHHTNLAWPVVSGSVDPMPASGYEGSRIGILISKRMVDLMGGRLEVDSLVVDGEDGKRCPVYSVAFGVDVAAVSLSVAIGEVKAVGGVVCSESAKAEAEPILPLLKMSVDAGAARMGKDIGDEMKGMGGSPIVDEVVVEDGTVDTGRKRRKGDGEAIWESKRAMATVEVHRGVAASAEGNALKRALIVEDNSIK
ncbi:hypothetical protein HDU97_008739 [Phlyctochytrium planicorne]|nr:hypothetical protein HDU97_008739 [Phlyctochytrium planicorne]